MSFEHPATVAVGGKALYGAHLGILMLEAKFPRIPGDMGNAQTWPFPVHYKVVRGASPHRVVRNKAEGLLDSFIQAAQELVLDGVDGITTNCGFLSLFQDELSAALTVPVATSSLLQVPLIETLLPKGQRVGILTISGSTLTEEHLVKAGCALDTPIGSTESGVEFTNVILNNELKLDVEKARQDNVSAAKDLVSKHPELGAIVLECTNMVPYAPDIRRATNLPVYSIESLIVWFQRGLSPSSFA